MNDTKLHIPGQPDRIEGDSRDLPNPSRAARRVRAYIAATGDGLYDVTDRYPLYGRDLEALVRTADEAEQWRATYGENALRDAQKISAERASLRAEVERLRAELAKAHQDGRNAAADAVEQMPYELGAEGWAALAAQAEEAGYPVEWVRSRRRRDDFTTATIGAAYQYGYRQAAKVARGVSR